MIRPHTEVLAPGGRDRQPPPPTGPPAWDGPPPPHPAPLKVSARERMRQLPHQVSIRWRLTLTYAALFFVAALALLLVIYVIVGWAIEAAWIGSYNPEVQEVLTKLQDAAIDAARAELVRRSVMVLIGMGLIAMILGYVVADRALKPVAKMTATARKLSESNLAHQRIDLKGPDDELKELADTFDEMLTRLNLAFDSQRRFVANASHELRTPLTINRTVLEIALTDPEASQDLKALGRTLLEVNARNEKLIEGLLLLARSERELAVRKPVDVKDVAATAVEQVLPFAEEHGVTITTDLARAGTVGDPVLLERSVSNLLENAVKYNLPESGKVWIQVGMSDGGAVVQVANTGQHVPAYEVNSLFEPFRRLHADRVDSAKGAGLGLSIVRAVVQAHGGSVTAAPREGGGLVVTVRLPGR
ncbi:sensor histidine kinase [Nonomuraea sp. NPDC050328]|uniref:sensor histidine kinase n=1 Tax=Nonomuraea sp. NPDC050328 TaxID=3364361 RepID=UPI0037B3ECA4